MKDEELDKRIAVLEAAAVGHALYPIAESREALTRARKSLRRYVKRAVKAARTEETLTPAQMNLMIEATSFRDKSSGFFMSDAGTRNAESLVEMGLLEKIGDGGYVLSDTGKKWAPLGRVQ